MRIPKFLSPTGTIGFVAPAFGCNIEPYRSCFVSAQEKLEKLGHKLVIGPNCYAGDGIGISSTPENCGREINDFFAREDIDVLLSCGGGELMCEILDHVDFEHLKQCPPKWFMGYSDNTNLTFLLPTLCDTVAVYGPCAPAMGMRQWHPAIQDAYDILTGKTRKVQGYPLWEKESLKSEENPLEPYHVTEQRVLYCEPAGQDIRIEGRLIGGCLDCLANLVGTKYDRVAEFTERYAEDGFIWFMEACDLNVMSIRRALWQLSHADWFRHVKGFLIGRPLCFGQEMFGLNQYNAVTSMLSHYNVPIIMDADIGHLPPMMPLVSGARAEVSVAGNDITIEMDLSESD